MPLGIWNLEWSNSNSQRSYPLADDATKTDLTGTFVLPDDFLLGLYFPIHAGIDVDVDRFFIYSVSVFATGYNVSIGYDDGQAVTVVASAIISQATHTPNMSYALPGVNAFDDSSGKLVVGILDSINLQPTGQFFFNYAGGKLDSDCIRPMIRGIQSIRVLNNGALSPMLTGHVVLLAGSNFNITITPATPATPTTPAIPAVIRFDAVDGAGLTESCDCTDDGTGGTAPAQPVLTINGIPPMSDGNFIMLGDSCLTVSPIINGVQLSDTCSSPCCGCQELEQITHEIEMIGSGATTVTNFVNRLATEVNTFSQVILGSRLNDQGCIQCS